MPNGSISLAKCPTAMVRLKCWKCGRSGQYRKATLVGKYVQIFLSRSYMRRIAANFLFVLGAAVIYWL